MGKVDIKTETIISKPRSEVSAYAADPDNATKWYVNISTVEWRTQPPLQKGSKVAFKARFLGKNLEYVYEITGYIPGEKLVMQTAQGPFPMKTTYLWEEIDPATTRMILRNTGFPRGFSKWFAPFMGYAMKRANAKDLRRLKQLLEN